MSIQNNFWRELTIKLGIGFICISPIGIYYLYKYFKSRVKNNFIESNNTFTSEITNSISDSISQPPLTEDKVNKVISKICENVLNNLALAYDIIREDYDANKKEFRNEYNSMKDFDIPKLKLGCNLKIKYNIYLIYQFYKIFKKKI